VSATFHGRDIFAPVAGALSNNVPPESFGELIDTHARLAPLAPVRDEGGAAWSAAIIHIDRFGNLVTNITRRELAGEEFERARNWKSAGVRSIRFAGFMRKRRARGGELFAIWGSAGFLRDRLQRCVRGAIAPRRTRPARARRGSQNALKIRAPSGVRGNRAGILLSPSRFTIQRSPFPRATRRLSLATPFVIFDST
jgi:hypothetical protein